MEILSQYFKAVPSNPHYFFYCPPSSKKEVSPEVLNGTDHSSPVHGDFSMFSRFSKKV